MLNQKRSLLTGGLGAILLCAAIGAPAQDNQDNSSGTVIGPPQLKDFQLRPQRRVTQPDLAAPGANPVRLAPPPPVTVQPQAVPAARSAAPAPVATLPTARPTARQSAPSAASAPAIDNRPAAAPRQLPVAAAPAPAGPVPAAPTAVEPQAPTATAAAPVAPEETGGGFNWLYAVPVALLALLGVALVRRRRGRDAQPVEAERAVAVAAPPRPPAAPRPDPVPRPWLELSLKAERAAFTDTEAEVLFELEIANKGGSAARDLRIDVKMFNAGAEQDKEIGAFFRTAGREMTKLKLPGVEAGVTGVIHGSVRMPREEMRALRLDERLLFIPVVAVNALYDWGQGRTGQTSKSYLVGREQAEPTERMGAFRVDQGPRIWRTVGQRPHKLARKV